ncbi:hypothetical protein B9Z55_022806 [Caenorhabditis nigoni]|uniref:Uncharacterized protein n=2 Tax=Caenorhabditis nigoni TaxID=1611254 RepID=A0A2G5SMB9_9PELO|nr:hypothetical protein B9Z55_022806 [Caenorhabditis nigoni]
MDIMFAIIKRKLSRSINSVDENMNETKSSKSSHLKRKTSVAKDTVPVKKGKELVLAMPSTSKAFPPEFNRMGIKEPIEIDYSRIPKGFKLGELAGYKFAGIVQANLYDKYEIQIYCRLFEHFAWYPFYIFPEECYVSAHDLAVSQVEYYRLSPYEKLRMSLSRPNSISDEDEESSTSSC